MTPAAALAELIVQLREAERLALARWERAVIVGADPREVAALDRAHVAAMRARALAEAHAELGGLREVGLGDARERAEASGRRWSPQCEATEERCAVATKARAPTPAFRVVSGARPPLRPSPPRRYPLALLNIDTGNPYSSGMLHAVAETPTFQRDAAAAGMSEAEKAELISFLAAHPQAGDLIPGTGGARKLRWRRPGTGKSGGYRVVTYHAGRDLPVFLLTLYAKGERANLSAAERNALRSILAGIAASYRGPRR